MKNLIYSFISFIIIVFISSQISSAQISRNPDPGRPVSRIPRPADGSNIPDRNRDNKIENTKERKNPPPQVNTPVNTKPEAHPEPPAMNPVYPHPLKPPKYIPKPGPVIIELQPEILIVASHEKYIDDNPVSEIEENESAIIIFDEILKRNSKDTLLYFLRGNAKLITKDYYGAIEDFTIYLRLVPWDKEAYLKRGLAFLYYGNKKEALLDFQIASELGYKKGDSIIEKYY
jgi:hypothetical protein